MAAARIAVAVGADESPPLLLRHGEEPIVGKLPQLLQRILLGPPAPFPPPKVHLPELVPKPPKPIIGVHQLAPQH